MCAYILLIYIYNALKYLVSSLFQLHEELPPDIAVFFVHAHNADVRYVMLTDIELNFRIKILTRHNKTMSECFHLALSSNRRNIISMNFSSLSKTFEIRKHRLMLSNTSQIDHFD